MIPLKPTLVIWETGTTDAVQGTDLDEFRQAVQAGIDRLRASGVEVVLMDAQFSRQTHAVINFDRYETVLREVTDANEVPLFRRHDIMRHWAENGLFDFITVDHDKLPLVASRLYDCIGRAVADFITRGAQPETSTPVPFRAIHEGSPRRRAGFDAPAERGSPCRRGTSGAALYCAYWGDPLEGGDAPYRPCHSPWRSTDHRCHRLLDRGYRRL